MIASLSADLTLAHVIDLAFHAHAMDPPHPYILRFIELIATLVAPALGWHPGVAARAGLAVAG